MLIIKGKISKLLYTKIKNFSLKKTSPLFAGREERVKIQNGKSYLWCRKLTKSSTQNIQI